MAKQFQKGKERTADRRRIGYSRVSRVAVVATTMAAAAAAVVAVHRAKELRNEIQIPFRRM